MSNPCAKERGVKCFHNLLIIPGKMTSGEFSWTVFYGFFVGFFYNL